MPNPTKIRKVICVSGKRATTAKVKAKKNVSMGCPLRSQILKGRLR